MSRGTHRNYEDHCFPNLTVSIKVGRSRGAINWIEAQVPEDFFTSRIDEWRWPILGQADCSSLSRSERRHHIANCLHIASMALELVKTKIADGDDEIQQFLSMALESFAELNALAMTKPAD